MQGEGFIIIIILFIQTHVSISVLVQHQHAAADVFHPLSLFFHSFHLLFVRRWTSLLEEIAERLRSSKALLQLWQRYKELYEQSCGSIQLQEEKADKLLKLACSKDIADEEVSDWIQECSVSGLILHTLSLRTAGAD